MVGSFLIIDLIATTTNAFNSSLLARQPGHYRLYTVVGLLLLAVATGIIGGVTRNVLLNEVPTSLENPTFIILCLAAGIAALLLEYAAGERILKGVLQFMTAFSLPWYATIGAQQALEAGLTFWPAILIGVISTCTARYFLDITSGAAPPLVFVRSHWFTGAAILSSSVYVLCAEVFGLSLWPATLIAAAVGFVFRLLALRWQWEEPLPRMPRDEPGDQTEAPAPAPSG